MERSPLAGSTVLVNMNNGQGNFEFRVEDYWINVSGKSWIDSGVIAAFNYANRVYSNNLPSDDAVLYGKIGSLGYLVHVSEIVNAGAPVAVES